ncbi:hypothetical protein ACH4FX_10100 [Streptomyces sp. NPDC018019]|uniref:hypothetical protein n=1 Tax=Streptomyces sp. NPDC018019 TaxID=3365030 RepID=UPI0037AEBA0C
MKAVLWLLLTVCLLANIYVSAVVGSGPQQILLSVVSGAGVLGAGAGLWLTRERRS